MSRTFNIGMIAPGKEPLRLEVESLVMSTKDGETEFKANHAPVILSIIPTATSITNGTMRERIFASPGIIHLKNNELKFRCDAVERESDIDVDRAKKSEERAEKRLKGDKNIDVERAKRALARASVRTSTISINHQLQIEG